MPHCSSIFRGLLISTALALLIFMSHGTQAAKQSTQPVHGRAPTVTLEVDTLQPSVGDIITVTSTFSDADGDEEFGTTYQWTLDGKEIEGAIHPSYTLSANDMQTGSKLNVTVIPRTDPEITLPSEGLPVQLQNPINLKWQRAIARLFWVEAPLGVVADGQATNTVHATVQHLDGTPAIGATVLFTADNLATISDSAQTDENGVATAYLKSVVAGMSTVTASIEKDSKSINTFFFAGPAQSVFAHVIKDNSLANNTDTNKVMIKVEDSYGNDVVDVLVRLTATNGVKVFPEISRTDSKGEVEVSLSSVAAVSSELTATTSNGITGSATVQFFDIERITHILVNGTSFSPNDGFPETGFVGAKFQLVVGNTLSNNSAYQWQVDQDWLSLDNQGNIRFNRAPSTGNNQVNITAKHLVTGAELHYSFTVARWFINNGFTLLKPNDAAAWCRAQGEGYTLPSYTQLTDRTPSAQSAAYRNTRGPFWNAWGNMQHYANNWISGNYWASEHLMESAQQYYVYLGNGNLFKFPEDEISYVACLKTILSH